MDLLHCIKLDRYSVKTEPKNITFKGKIPFNDVSLRLAGL